MEEEPIACGCSAGLRSQPRHQLETPAPSDCGRESRGSGAGAGSCSRAADPVAVGRCRVAVGSRSIVAGLSDGLGVPGWVLRCLKKGCAQLAAFLVYREGLSSALSLQEGGSVCF